MSPMVTDNLAAEPSAHHVHILIVGSGFAGLGAAIRLSQRGETDFVVLERGTRSRWYLARQHLPRRRLRRPLPAVLVLVRPQPGLDPLVLLASRRSSATSSPLPTRFDVRDKHRFGCDVTGARWNAERARVGGRNQPGCVHRRRRDRRGRRAVRAALPDIQGIEDFAGEIFHSARWDHDADLYRQAGRGDRHRRLGDPDRPRDRAAGRAPRRVPAHRAMGTAPRGSRLLHSRAPRVQVRPRRAAPLPPRRLRGARDAGRRAGQGPDRDEAARVDWRAPNCGARSRTRTCARRSPRTSGSAASAC